MKSPLPAETLTAPAPRLSVPLRTETRTFFAPATVLCSKVKSPPMVWPRIERLMPVP